MDRLEHVRRPGWFVNRGVHLRAEGAAGRRLSCTIGIDVLQVVVIRVCLEATSDERVWRPYCNLIPAVPRIILSTLCADIPDNRMEARVDEFSIVFSHDLFLNQRGVFVLPRECRLECQKHRGQRDLLNEALEHSDTRLRVQWCQGKGQHVYQHMNRAEQTKKLKRCGQRVPEVQLPHIACLVWMGSRLGALTGEFVQEPQGGGCGRRRLNSHSLRRRRACGLFDIGFEESVRA